VPSQWQGRAGQWLLGGQFATIELVRIGLKRDLELDLSKTSPPKTNNGEHQKLHKIKQGFEMDVV